MTQLIADVATAVADLDHRVVVDKPKPDPEGGVSSRRVGGQRGSGAERTSSRAQRGTESAVIEAG